MTFCGNCPARRENRDSRRFSYFYNKNSLQAAKYPDAPKMPPLSHAGRTSGDNLYKTEDYLLFL